MTTDPTPVHQPSSSSARGAVQVVLPGAVEPEGMDVQHVAVPQPGPGQVLLRVEATGVSFAEQQMRRGKYYDQPAFPFVPGYDVVGVVEQTGEGVEAGAVGHRYAVLTKTGGWASHLVVDADALVAVPAGVDPAAAESLVVNGLTAWQMLHRVAQVRPGQTVLVLGANGGVGTTLVQLALEAGARVIASAAPRHHAALQALGADVVASRTPDHSQQVRALAPGGVDAVFDHVGGPGAVQSWQLLRPGGSLVCYGTASTRDDAGDSRKPVLVLVARLAAWNLLPNGRSAAFFNIWSGARRRDRFTRRLREDLGEVLTRLADGRLVPQIAAQLPLERVAEAIRLAESGTVVGKVVLRPDTAPEPVT